MTILLSFVLITASLKSSVEGIQCFYCEDVLVQASTAGGNLGKISTNHSNSCGSMNSFVALNCANLRSCSKTVTSYIDSLNSEIRQVVQRSCWNPNELKTKNYTVGRCYKEPKSKAELCLCEYDYCNTSTQKTVFPITSVMIVLYYHSSA